MVYEINKIHSKDHSEYDNIKSLVINTTTIVKPVIVNPQTRPPCNFLAQLIFFVGINSPSPRIYIHTHTHKHIITESFPNPNPKMSTPANYSYLPPNLIPDDANPDWYSKADNAWQLTAATMVMLQSVPGLIILYGGAVKKKWAVNSAFMALYAFAAVLVCWSCWGYQLSFGDKMVPFWGKVNVALSRHYLFEKAFLGSFPNATMAYFQFAFAALTLILVAGAVLGRMNFYAWMIFVPLWLTFSYTIGAFSIWSTDGWLATAGLIDYSGGYVIHLSSGVAGFTAAFWVIFKLG